MQLETRIDTETNHSSNAYGECASLVVYYIALHLYGAVNPSTSYTTRNDPHPTIELLRLQHNKKHSSTSATHDTAEVHGTFFVAVTLQVWSAHPGSA